MKIVGRKLTTGNCRHGIPVVASGLLQAKGASGMLLIPGKIIAGKSKCTTRQTS